MQLNKAVVVIGCCFIFIHKIKIDSAAVCGFLFPRMGHAQDKILLTPVCLQHDYDGGFDPDELDSKSVRMQRQWQTIWLKLGRNRSRLLRLCLN